tara:strand:- start:36 stop:602 length:567 start_codon:yes stop_codon:yes gene_type:complete
MKKLIFIVPFIFILACQPIEKNQQVVFDNNQFTKFDILSKKIEIKKIFEKKISDPYIGYTLKISPDQRIVNWITDNFNPIGNENNFIVNILDASIIQTEFKIDDAKNFDEKNNFKYEIFYLVEYNLFDNTNNLIASTLVEITRSTTSGVYISIQDKENIINDLIYQGLVDLSNESKILISKYMADYIL